MVTLRFFLEVGELGVYDQSFRGERPLSKGVHEVWFSVEDLAGNLAALTINDS